MQVVRLSALRASRLYLPGDIPGTHFCQRLSQPHGHSAAGRIMAMKNSNDTFRLVAQGLNQLRHRVPHFNYLYVDYLICYNEGCTKSRVTKFCTVAPNICWSSVWNLLHVTLLEPRILRRQVYFSKIYASLPRRHRNGTDNTEKTAKHHEIKGCFWNTDNTG